ncbi:serine/threonine-protein kinase haspin homolog isoform X2 [Helianthus annuus]|uniref:serine/threonine-protein kinase haspin homolog isoform X2 n=1 Tax=Helianthus annuus TaxID=4232 RepID=UPI001652BAED|nr:serine/threonine-protein kinase haspin homolog isoform X2 [Helianthus annuus]
MQVLFSTLHYNGTIGTHVHQVGTTPKDVSRLHFTFILLTLEKAEELLEEVMLSLTLNDLRGNHTQIHNVCSTFIQTLSLRVCDGVYDDAMIRAREEWDKKHFPENDHPTEFAEKQRFVVLVQEHGGQDLESFVLLDFNEARSLLVQVEVASI